MSENTAVVVGANGIIGGRLVKHLSDTGRWNVVGLSRRGGEQSARVRHVAVDLLDSEQSRQQLASLAQVTHIFYAAYQDRPTWAELVEPNVTMLRNALDAIEPVAINLRHVSLMQGYKVYGAHLGPFKSPAREEDAGRHMPPEFNVDQQRLLEERQREGTWTWSAIRPSVVGGSALGNPMNLVTLIATYATISKQLGIPLRFPGNAGAYDSLLEMTDAGLLAEATEWAATSEAATNEAFNINNGDIFRWSEIWPMIADYFELEVMPPLPIKLSVVMADKAPLWQQIIEKNNLVNTAYEDVAAWPFGDVVFSWNYDMIADGSKMRRAGFHGGVKTSAMFFSIFDELRERRIIP